MTLFSPETRSRLSRLTAPMFDLRIDNMPSNNRLKERLLSVQVTLNNGHVSDQLSLVLDDRPQFLGAGIALPRQGVSLSASMGYETHLATMGNFSVNNITLGGSGSGRTLTVSATPPLLNNCVTRNWNNTTIQRIIESIAATPAYGLEAKVSPNLADEQIDTLNQFNESDSGFLTRLAERFDAVCKPMSGKLLFMRKGEGTSASGEPMPTVNIYAHDIVQWHKSVSGQQAYNKVCAYWYDYQQAADQEVYYPPSDPQPGDTVLRLKQAFLNQHEAEQAASAKMAEILRESTDLSLTMLGNPDITAEGKITLHKVREDVDGDYIVRRATHSFSSGGYLTSVDAYFQAR